MKIAVLDVSSIGGGLDYSPLDQIGEVSYYDYTGQEQVADRLKGIEVSISNKTVYDGALMDACPALKLICITGTGYNNIDVKAAAKRGIGVCNVKDYCTSSVAQHTLAMVLQLQNKIHYYDRYVKSGSYIGDESFKHYKDVTYRELDAMKWGIVGMGSIGRAVAGLAEAFGCQVVYYSTSGKNKEQPYEEVSFDEMVSVCDIITIHAPLNDLTRDLFTYDTMSRMKKDALIVNVGRGGIINESDIPKVLRDNLIGGIGLDVLTEEPMSAQSPLVKVLNDDRLLITPHVAWAGLEARQRVIQEVADNIYAYISGGKRNRVESL